MSIYTSLFKGFTLISLAAAMVGCNNGGGLPARKKMPEFNNYNDELEGTIPFERNGLSRATTPFSFNTSNVDLVLNGVPRDFVMVPLPDASNDSLAISLINSFRPFALPLIASWSHEQHKGVAIDLSSHSGAEVRRSDFILEKTGDFVIPVLILWDAGTGARVASLRALVSSFSSVQFSQTSGAAIEADGLSN